MAPEPAPIWRIQAFDPDLHDRASFSCGLERIDNFLKITARKHQDGDFTRVYVATRADSAAIIGYYALNAHSLAGPEAPDALSKRGPRHSIPAAYLSMIGVNVREQGIGLGVILLADALKRVLRAADSIDLKAVVLDVVDDDGDDAYRRRLAFYRRMGFCSFPSRESRMFLAMKDIRAAFAE